MPKALFVAPTVIPLHRSCGQSCGHRASHNGTDNGTGNGKGGGDGGNDGNSDGDGDDGIEKKSARVTGAGAVSIPLRKGNGGGLYALDGK
jgi:hypothetical protein